MSSILALGLWLHMCVAVLALAGRGRGGFVSVLKMRAGCICDQHRVGMRQPLCGSQAFHYRRVPTEWPCASDVHVAQALSVHTDVGYHRVPHRRPGRPSLYCVCAGGPARALPAVHICCHHNFHDARSQPAVPEAGLPHMRQGGVYMAMGWGLHLSVPRVMCAPTLQYSLLALCSSMTMRPTV